MADYSEYTGREPWFALGYPEEDQFGSPHDEAIKTEAIGRLIQLMLDGLGPGIYSGLEGSVVAGNCSLTAGRALIPDDVGTVPVLHIAEVLAAGGFAAGTSYVHVQLGETARAEGDCGYYVSASDVPAPDALLVCKVTKVGSVVTEVDNSVRAAPALTERIPWTELLATFGGADTLLDFLTAVLGAPYFTDPGPDSIASRLAVLEAEGGGGGGGGTSAPNWGLLIEAPGVSTTIRQAIQEMLDDGIADHITAYHQVSGGGGGTTETIVEEEWDVMAVNEIRLTLQALHVLPRVAETAVEAAFVLDGHYGHGEDDGVNWVDDENSTF